MIPMNNTAVRLMADLQNTRVKLSDLLTQAVQQGQKIADARARFKVTEDTVVAEIWNNENYKNDRVRNEQKHLARINDARLIDGQKYIDQLEMDKAKLHGQIFHTQNELTLLTIQYQAVMTYNLPDVQFKLVAVEKEQADTTKAVELETAVSHPVVGEEPVPAMPATADFVCGSDEVAGDHQAKKVDSMASAPYFATKPDAHVKGKQEKKPEKIGNIRI